MRLLALYQHAGYLTIISVGLVLIVAAMWIQGLRTPKSGFKVRESDRIRRWKKSQDDLGKQRAKRKGPQLLSGHRFDGLPHEVLGVPEDANKDEIQAAYHDLIKRFHPDKIGRPGSREWKDAQDIATRLNEARQQMLSRLK